MHKLIKSTRIFYFIFHNRVLFFYPSSKRSLNRFSSGCVPCHCLRRRCVDGALDDVDHRVCRGSSCTCGERIQIPAVQRLYYSTYVLHYINTRFGRLFCKVRVRLRISPETFVRRNALHEKQEINQNRYNTILLHIPPGK